jgi:ubiquinone/menaquinone biosynthesis C-methylase UbiE
MISAIGAAARIVVGVVLAIYIVRQCRRPSSVTGRFLARRMNASHAALTQWGLSHVNVGEQDAILDVGCGGGRTIETLASKTSGTVCGIDYSSASVMVARQRNRAGIETGRVRIEEGLVSALPFANGTFDLATAVETHYYWPDLPADVREVVRVLKPGGTFIVIAETYRGRRNDWLYRPVMRLMLGATYLTPEQHRILLVDAGCSGVEVFEEKARGWICAVGHACA